MSLKSYGRIKVTAKEIIIERCEPHVSIKLKEHFHRIEKHAIPPYKLPYTDDYCRDFVWFMIRYPFTIGSAVELKLLYDGSARYAKRQRATEALLAPDYKPKPVKLVGKLVPRKYQVIGNEMAALVQRLLIADDIGIGKTLTSILGFLDPGTLPACVVVQTHMQAQWKENIESNTNLKVYTVKKAQQHNLPKADVYLFRYSQLAGWVNYFELNPFKYCIFDEVQELRRSGSDKYKGGKVLSNSCERVTGLSATPIYNYGDEIYNVLDLIKEGSLGPKYSFLGEWCSVIGIDKYKVDDPDALGSYLREANLILRRRRADVGMELPRINTIVQPVEHDEQLVVASQNVAKILAQKILDPSVEWKERGQAALEFDLMIRRDTGISKAIHVAGFIRMLAETGESVLVGCWHRAVYDILVHELKDLNPVMYTGSESVPQKEAAKRAFMTGESKVMLMSNRSGAGVDGLQNVCSTVVHAELDWSPKVHDQFCGRIDRYGQKNPVTQFFCISDYGSDPPMVDVLGLKASQSHGIMNPGIMPQAQHTDESRVREIAQRFLK